jgi:hypothetical protein
MGSYPKNISTEFEFVKPTTNKIPNGFVKSSRGEARKV